MSGPGAGPAPWVDDRNAALLTDLYELTMLQAYVAEGLREPAVFELFVRRLPERRNYLIACGLEDVLRYLERLRFPPEGLEALASRGGFTAAFLEYLAGFRFTGDVRAMPEGTPVFAGEPFLEVAAPLPEAQLVETFLMNQLHVQTLAASKASRVVAAAAGRPVVDFGLRRTHGTDAGMKAARAFHIAGVAATSNVLAGLVYHLPLSGTMGHSYVQAHASESEAFRRFQETQSETVLLVDTYDTLEGVREVVRLARSVGGPRPRAVRLDSGDLAELSRASRRILDEGGLEDVEIFASGGLDEDAIDRLVRAGAPIDGFGVGSSMAVSADAPDLDFAYKLVEYAGQGRLKLSPGKETLPGRKQVFRLSRDGESVRDMIATMEEDPGEAAARIGEEDDRGAASKSGATGDRRGARGGPLESFPLLEPAMRRGRRLPAGEVSLEVARARAASELARLPARLRGLEPAETPYEVAISPRLRARTEALRRAREHGR